MDLDLRGTRLANFDESFELFEHGKLHFTSELSSWNWEQGLEGLGSTVFSPKLDKDRSSETCEMICPTSLLVPIVLK